mgnify:CR=1 FL=1
MIIINKILSILFINRYMAEILILTALSAIGYGLSQTQPTKSQILPEHISRDGKIFMKQKN